MNAARREDRRNEAHKTKQQERGERERKKERAMDGGINCT